MEHIFRQQKEQGNENDPPFNFRAILRKTYNPKSSECLVFSTETNLDFPNEKNITLPQNELIKTESQKFETVVTEIAPGILIHGEVAEL